MAAPVMLPPTRASARTVSPMPKPPSFGAAGDTAVPNTALTRKKVRIASIQTPCVKVTLPASLGVPPRARSTARLGRTALTSAAPRTAPRSWAMMYCTASLPSILFAIQSPVVTAGLMCPPEMLIVAETAMASAMPCASATPTRPIGAAEGPAAANATVLPAPRNTNSSVPTNSAVSGRRSLNMTGVPRVEGDGNLGRGLGAPQHQGRVDPAEPERVRHHDLGRRGPPLAREAIEVARGVGALEIDGGREPAPLDRERADPRLDRAARAQRVAVIPLGAAHAEAVGVLREHLLDGGGLGGVVERGRGAVGVDVADVGRVDVSAGGREPHGRRRLPSVPPQRGPVVCDVSEAVAH